MLYRLLKTKIRHKVAFAGFALALTAGTSSCNNDGNSSKATTSEIKNISTKLSSKRLDIALAKLDTNNIAAGLETLKPEYGEFLDFYLDTLMGFNINGNYVNTNPGVAMGLKSFLTHKDYRGLFDTVAKHYPNTNSINEKLAEGFANMKEYYPAYHIPGIVYLTSGLNNWGAFTVDTTTLGIGLDMFLGADYPYYKSVGIPEYTYIQLQEPYIPVAVFRAIYQDQAPFVMEERNLLDMMVQRGKEMYFLGKIIPFVPEALRFGFTDTQLKWCTDNEAQLYNFFIAQNLLYETNWQKILRYVKEGPTSAGMPAESPGNTGTWIGYRIVLNYMKENPKVTLQELLKSNISAPQLLQQSRYKPR